MPGEKCAQCGKTVYVVEKLTLLNQVWHKWCFKCQTCSMTLTMKNYSAVGGKPYCKAHYPMPTATGSTQENVASVGYDSAPPPATDQSLAEVSGTSDGYGGGYDDGQYGGGEQYYDDGQYGGEQYYEEQYYEQ